MHLDDAVKSESGNEREVRETEARRTNLDTSGRSTPTMRASLPLYQDLLQWMTIARKTVSKGTIRQRLSVTDT